jgi:hypothetical protein
VKEEKDLGVVVSNDLKNSKQCLEACKKANTVDSPLSGTLGN